MATLRDCDLSKPIELRGMAYDLDNPAELRGVDSAKITLQGAELSALMNWITNSEKWAEVFEEDLQGIAETLDGEPLLSTWLPLVDFRYKLCSCYLHGADTETIAVLQSLFHQTREWRDMGIDMIGIDAYAKV